VQAIHDVPAPAKLNLFLHITGRRADGYHLLQSAFVLIDWCDTLHFERREGGALSREDLGEPLPAEDLVLRAARALQQATGTSAGAHIRIDKCIPSQAGMGGGSSDAASTLLALNRLWDTRLRLAELERIGLALGADVPFFLRGRSAWVEGVGEKITPIALPPARFVVVKPPEGLETARIFQSPELERNSEAAIISGFAANPWGEFSKNPFGFGKNVLQPVAEKLCPGVAQGLQWLASQGLAGRMTGSGSAVFAVLPPGVKPAQAPSGWRVRECSKMEVHPLAGWAASDDSSVGG
jgi:4-diphosphocytidyl-2-C-methyl-D-erythritol kinase